MKPARDRMDPRLEAEFLRVEPDARWLGERDGFRRWHSVAETPAHRFDSIVAFPAEGGVLQTVSRSGFDPAVVDALLLRLAHPAPGARPHDALDVEAGFACPGRAFETAVHVPPAIARRFGSTSALLAASTSWVFPGFACEFRSGHGEQAFWFGIRDGGIDALDWNRRPTPLVRAQLLSAWPGGSLRVSRKPLFLDVASLCTALPGLPVTVEGMRILSSGETELHVRRRTARTFHLTVTLPSGERRTADVPSGRLASLVRTTLETDSLSPIESLRQPSPSAGSG